LVIFAGLRSIVSSLSLIVSESPGTLLRALRLASLPLTTLRFTILCWTTLRLIFAELRRSAVTTLCLGVTEGPCARSTPAILATTVLVATAFAPARYATSSTTASIPATATATTLASTRTRITTTIFAATLFRAARWTALTCNKASALLPLPAAPLTLPAVAAIRLFEIFGEWSPLRALRTACALPHVCAFNVGTFRFL
jgi:hypothetical protein